MRNRAAETGIEGDITAGEPGQEPGKRSFAAELARSRRELFRSAALLTQDQAEADDLVQETLERALLAEVRFQPGTNLRAWLRAILRNLFIDGRRCARFTVPLTESPELRAPCGGRAWGPLDVLNVEDVIEGMEDLPPRQAQLLRLAHIERMSYRELSRRFGIPINTAATQLFRARAKLRPKLEAVASRRLAELMRRGGSPVTSAGAVSPPALGPTSSTRG